MEEKKLWYVITCHQKHEQTGEENTYLMRLTDDLETAQKLMQTTYEDAKEGRHAKFGGFYHQPKWLDDKHRKLQITYDVQVGYTHITYTETYQLNDEWDDNIFDNKPWIIE